MRPNTLAEELVGTEKATAFGKQIRGRLRAWYPRDTKGTSWDLTDEQELAIRTWHAAKLEGKTYDPTKDEA